MDKTKDVEQKVKMVKGFSKDKTDRGSSNALDSQGNGSDDVCGTINGSQALGDFSDKSGSYSYQLNDVSTSSSRAFRFDETGKRFGGVGDIEQSVNEAIDKDPNGNAYADTKYKSVSTGGVRTAGKWTPSFGMLVKTDPNGSKVDAVKGTLDKPNVYSKIKPENIFINNKPEVDDVRQGNIGDCYFLSALLHILQTDPQKIPNMMSVSGNQVTTKFFYQASGFLGIKSWKEVSVTTQIGELERTMTNSEDGTTTTEVMGSSYRLEYEPSTSVWTADIVNNEEYSVLDITRKDYYQAALWVIAIEQAYEAYAQKYGQYGTSGESGKELIAGIHFGSTKDGMNIFYGKDVTERSIVETTAAEADEILEANKDVVKCLWNFQRSQSGDYKNDVYLASGNTVDKSIDRFDYYKGLMKRALEATSHSDKSDALQAVDDISEKIEAYNADRIAKEGTDEQPVIDTSGINALTQKLYGYESVHEVSRDILTPFQNSVANVVMDGRHNLYIYSAHAYNISNVQLVDSSGNLVTGSDFNKVFKQIDPDKSTVTMQNPWGCSTANIDGTSKNGEGDYGKDHGTFTTTLEEYLSSVHNLYYVEINK